MKLLVDAKLLVEILDQLGLDATHVDDLPKGDETSDAEISNYVDTHDLMVVTKDIDFYHSYTTVGKLKRLFLITTGNLKNRQLFNLFRNNILVIKNALKRSNFVELSNSGLIEH